MIKNYNLFLINEGITLENDDIIDIIKSLESEDNKNAALINRLVNHTDKNGKTVLMNIVQSNNEELIDYVLKFDVDINHKLKTGENVLFFCKNAKIFNKFYKLGADVRSMNIHIRRNILTHLAYKKIFNEELYQNLINDGVDVNGMDINGQCVLIESISNQKILLLLIKNKVDLNNETAQICCLINLFDILKWYKNKKIAVLKIFEILFNNGMNIIDVKQFVEEMMDIYYYIELFSDFLIPLKKYISEKILLEIVKEYINSHLFSNSAVEFVNKVLDIGIYPEIYQYLKKYYGNRFENYFEDYIKKHPYLDDSHKYNL